MKSFSIILLIGLIFLLVIFFLLKKCSGFVSSIDGERKSKMIEIAGDYYYNQNDFKIWQREHVCVENAGRADCDGGGSVSLRY